MNLRRGEVKGETGERTNFLPEVPYRDGRSPKDYGPSNEDRKIWRRGIFNGSLGYFFGFKSPGRVLDIV